jgi:predicted acetyltransferase
MTSNNKIKTRYVTYSKTHAFPGITEKMPRIKTAQKIADFFRKNYPTMYNLGIKNSDLTRYQTGKQIIAQTEEGNVWVLKATSPGKIQAILKFRWNKLSENTTHKEILISWLMVDVPFRNQGIATRMVKKTLKIFKNLKHPVVLLADVHVKNMPSRKVFQNCGFAERKSRKKLFLVVYKNLD